MIQLSLKNIPMQVSLLFLIFQATDYCSTDQAPAVNTAQPTSSYVPEVIWVIYYRVILDAKRDYVKHVTVGCQI